MKRNHNTYSFSSNTSGGFLVSTRGEETSKKRREKVAYRAGIPVVGAERKRRGLAFPAVGKNGKSIIAIALTDSRAPPFAPPLAPRPSATMRTPTPRPRARSPHAPSLPPSPSRRRSLSPTCARGRANMAAPPMSGTRSAANTPAAPPLTDDRHYRFRCEWPSLGDRETSCGKLRRVFDITLRRALAANSKGRLEIRIEIGRSEGERERERRGEIKQIDPSREERNSERSSPGTGSAGPTGDDENVQPEKGRQPEQRDHSCERAVPTVLGQGGGDGADLRGRDRAVAAAYTRLRQHRGGFYASAIAGSIPSVVQLPPIGDE